MKKLVILTLIISLVSLAGCVIEIDGNTGFSISDKNLNIDIKPGVTVKTGALNTYTEEFELENQKDLDVDIKVNAANLVVDKTEEKLFTGRVDTNVIGLKPIFSLNGNKLNIRDDFRYNGISNFTNDWTLELTNQIPMSIDLNSNASKNELDLTGMQITDMKLNLNASNTDIRFDEKNEEVIRRFRIDTNAGNTDIWGLGNGRVEEIDIKINAGKIELDFGNEIFNNTDINVDGNASKVVIDLPDNVGVRIIKNGSLSSIELNRSGFNREGNDEYKSENYNAAEFTVDINVRGTASSVTIK